MEHDYVTVQSNGKLSVNKKSAYCFLIPSLLTYSDTFLDILRTVDSTIQNRYPDITSSALNNCHGDWYEWFLAVEAWNYYCENDSDVLLVKLPNVRRFDVANLYSSKTSSLIEDLRAKVRGINNVELITSNPDFVIVRPKNELHKKNPIYENTIESVTFIDEMYKYYIGVLDFDDVIGYLSAKTSLRPDRRLQIPHEGSLMKAIYTHIQTRGWILSPLGLKYYAVATRVNPADRDALSTVATHSITTVHRLPERAVDDVFVVNSREEARDMFARILVSHS